MILFLCLNCCLLSRSGHIHRILFSLIWNRYKSGNLKDIWLILHFSFIGDDAMTFWHGNCPIVINIVVTNPLHVYSSFKCHDDQIILPSMVYLECSFYVMPPIFVLLMVSIANLIFGPFSVWTTFQPRLYFPLLTSKPISGVKLAKYSEVSNLFLNLIILWSITFPFNERMTTHHFLSNRCLLIYPWSYMQTTNWVN